MRSSEKMFTVDKFLGVNEEADGYTELRAGEASEMVNFTITDGLNLTLRPGVQRVEFAENRELAPILASWAGFICEDGTQEYLVVVDFFGGHDRIYLCARDESTGKETRYVQEGALGLTSAEDHMVKIFAFGGRMWITSRANSVSYRSGRFIQEQPYVPLVIVGASPSGGGTMLEGINMLTSLRRIDYSADGESFVYALPLEAQSVQQVIIDNQVYSADDVGTFRAETHTFTFKDTPPKGVGNVEFTYDTFHADTEKSRLEILGMPLVEAYNGSADTRLFVAGNGNICYYTGVTQSGEATPMYFPAMNYVAVDMTGSSVTGLVKHYTKLLVYTRDGVYTLSYEPVTTESGATTAGFYLRSANREFGNDVLGQICTVGNFPRTFTGGGIYSWNIPASFYRDERYAKHISGPVQRTLRGKDIHKFVACDNGTERTYYVFLNDSEGTVLAGRYRISKEDVWCIFRGSIFTNIQKAFTFNGRTVFQSQTEIFGFGDNLTKDAPVVPGGKAEDIMAVWKSGFMDFGADFRRKFASQIYVSMLPRAHSRLIVTAETDRRSEYVEKEIQTNVFDWKNADFQNWTFCVDNTPRIKEIKIKAKKFVYYRLVFRVDGNGATATILSYNQRIKFGSSAK